jgi:hypothetical protein
MKFKLLLGIVLSLLATSCSNTPRLDELRQSVNNSATILTQEISTDELVSTAKYVPVEQVFEGQPIPVDSRQYQYYTLSISPRKQKILNGEFSRYSQLIQTLAFKMSAFCHLEYEDGTEAPLVNSSLDRTFESDGSHRIMLVFERPREACNVTLVVNEFGMQTGTMRFSFSQEALTTTPTVD